MTEATADTMKQLQEFLGHDFKNPKLLESAMTHRSFRAPDVPNYERLEFLGDSVLDLVVSGWLMNQFPNYSEGDLSQMRSRLVNRDTLSRISTSLGFDQYLRMGQGDFIKGERGKQSILADVFEALVGALYLDAGFNQTKDWVSKVLDKFVSTDFDLEEIRDYKSLLQEWTQSHQLHLPIYTLLKELGPDHQKEFTVQCTLRSGESAEGSGPTKKLAEQEAARSLVSQLGLLKDAQ